MRLFLTKLHGTVTMEDDSKVFPSQLLGSDPPADPQPGAAFDATASVGRLSLQAVYTPDQIRWSLHPATLFALATRYLDIRNPRLLEPCSSKPAGRQFLKICRRPSTLKPEVWLGREARASSVHRSKGSNRCELHKPETAIAVVAHVVVQD